MPLVYVVGIIVLGFVAYKFFTSNNAGQVINIITSNTTNISAVVNETLKGLAQ